MRACVCLSERKRHGQWACSIFLSSSKVSITLVFKVWCCIPPESTSSHTFTPDIIFVINVLSDMIPHLNDRWIWCLTLLVSISSSALSAPLTFPLLGQSSCSSLPGLVCSRHASLLTLTALQYFMYFLETTMRNVCQSEFCHTQK